MIGILSQLHILLNVAMALILGGIIGSERERSNKPAGARTQAIVAGAAALIVSVGAVVDSINHLGDPTRAMHGVITGIGFLGAGIMSGAGQFAGRGITTATTVFMTAGIGSVVGLGAPITALGTTLLVLLTLRLGTLINKNIYPKKIDVDDPELV